MSRKSLGMVAALLLVVGAFVWLRGPEGGSGNAFAFGCIRVGLVLGAGWLAYPQILAIIKQSPRWLLSWFIGSNAKAPPTRPLDKSAGPPTGTAAASCGGASSQTVNAAPVDSPRPAPRVKKPRRRSNS